MKGLTKQAWAGRRPGMLWALLIALPVFAAPAEIWVAPNGSDQALGTKEQPLATPAMALRRARDLRRLQDPSAKDGITIRLRGGRYELGEPLRVRSEYSGTAESPTVIESAEGETAMFSGGTRIVDWTEATDAPGLPTVARGQVWTTAAPRIGGRPLDFSALWVRGEKATRAQTPNAPAMERLRGWDRRSEEAIVPAQLVATLGQPAGVEMVLEQQWEIAILRLRTIEREGERARLTFQSPESTLEFQHPWPQPVLPPKGGGAFYLVNAIEFLDAPGEWFEDAASGRVYYWPRAGEDLTHDEVIAPRLEKLLVVAGTLDRPVRHVVFRGIAFAHAAWNAPEKRGHVPLQAAMPMTEAYKLSKPGTPEKRGLENQAWIVRAPAAVVVDAAQAVSFEGCRFEHLGSSSLDLRRGVRRSAIEGCVFRDIGANGIQVGSFQEGGVETHVPYAPADDREICADIRIANNVLRDTANADWGAVAVIAGYARGLTIEHNDIADTSYTGISVGWGWTSAANASRMNRVHANRIVRAATRVCDTAGIYTLSAQPGTIINENFVDAMAMSPYVDRPDHWFYLYTDEGTSGVTVRDNWCPAEKFLQNANGPGNDWQNNGPQVSADIERRAGLEPKYQALLQTLH